MFVLSVLLFDVAGWFQRVKHIKCKDGVTLECEKKVDPKLKDLWKDEQLKIVGQSNIPET